jgi:hypothetical protein
MDISFKAILCLLMLVFLILPSAADDIEDNIGGLQDPDPQIRGIAAEKLGSIGDPIAVDPLVRALKDDNSYVRIKAAWALGKIGDPRAVDPLIEALKDEVGNVQSSAATALGSIGDPKAIDPLTKILNDEGIKVLDDERMLTYGTSAAQALGEIVGKTGKWESFSPDPAAFAAQPGSVFPLRSNPIEAGSYLIMIGPSGVDGLDIPPKSWYTCTPTELKGGHKYKFSICSGTADYGLDFEEDKSDLISYSDPGPGLVSAYIGANPICKGREEWHAICLWKIKPGSSSSAATEQTPSVEQKPSSHTSDPEIVGDSDSVAKIKNALELLKTKAPEHYAIVANYIGKINVSDAGSGMHWWESPPRFQIGKASVDQYGPDSPQSPILLAGTILHDAVHSKLAHDYLSEHPGTSLDGVPKDITEGKKAESLCLAAQLDVLKKLGAVEENLEEIKNSAGSNYWEVPEDKRWW